MHHARRISADLNATLADIDQRLDNIVNQVQAIDDSDNAELFLPLDGALCGVYHGLKDCIRFSLVYAEARHDLFDPAETLRQYNASRPLGGNSSRISVKGDKRIVATVLQLLQENIKLSAGGRLQMRLYTEGTIRYTYNFADGNTLGDSISVGKNLQIPISSVHNAWESATDGGYMEVSEDGIVLYLDGEAPDLSYGDSAMNDVRYHLAPAVLRLKSWRSPSGAYEGPFASTPEAKKLYAQAAGAAQKAILGAVDALR